MTARSESAVAEPKARTDQQEKLPICDTEAANRPLQMRHPPCEQKDRLLGVYMEAVRTHADTVGLLKAVRDEPKAFSSALKKAKEAYAACGRVKSELEKHCKTHEC